MLLEPRWDEEEFGLIKDRAINGFTRNKANPGYMAAITLDKLMYGENNILAVPLRWDRRQLFPNIEMDDLKDYYQKTCSPHQWPDFMWQVILIRTGWFRHLQE